MPPDGRLARKPGGTLAAVPKVSVVVITLNEASHIDDALASVAWADEIVVVDSGSTDNTVQLAERHTDRVTSHAWPGYGAQKDHATSLASHDWVLSLDADERVTPELAAEITARLDVDEDPPHRGYRIPRTTRYAGRWMRTTDWYPDYQLRLYDRRVASWSTDLVHESVRVDGPVGTLARDIQHYAYPDLSSHVATINRYTTLAADQLTRDGRTAGLVDVLVHPPAAFLRNYLLHRGCLQGSAGFLVSVMNSYYVFLKYAKLRERVMVERSASRGDR
jgi:glycosyltransferase involved in cell wall biosynthesis